MQKAVVVIADNPQSFGTLKERLSIVTHAWFDQREFTDTEILRRFQESLADEKERGLLNGEEGHDTYLGMSLREMIHEFRWQALVLLKCCLLQPKVRQCRHARSALEETMLIQASSRRCYFSVLVVSGFA